MNFTKKRAKKGRKIFLAEEGYRIIWRRTVCGVRVPARFQASVKAVLPYGEMWDRVTSEPHWYKTMTAAQKACEKHYRLWSKACEAPGLRAIRELFGRLPLGLPKWAMTKINPRIRVAMLCASPSGRTSLSLTSDDEDTTDTNGPASDAGAGDSSPSASSTSKSRQSHAKTAAQPAKGRSKRSSRSTGGSSRSTKKTCASTRRSSKRSGGALRKLTRREIEALQQLGV